MPQDSPIKNEGVVQTSKKFILQLKNLLIHFTVFIVLNVPDVYRASDFSSELFQKRISTAVVFQVTQELIIIIISAFNPINCNVMEPI